MRRKHDPQRGGKPTSANESNPEGHQLRGRGRGLVRGPLSSRHNWGYHRPDSPEGIPSAALLVKTALVPAPSAGVEVEMVCEGSGLRTRSSCNFGSVMGFGGCGFTPATCDMEAFWR